jgi:sugar (pentulose or hexulose) kinase
MAERIAAIDCGTNSIKILIGEDGKPLAAQSTLSDPRTSTSRTPTAWWTTEWRSVQLAGDPPSQKPKQKPLSYLGGKNR